MGLRATCGRARHSRNEYERMRSFLTCCVVMTAAWCMFLAVLAGGVCLVHCVLFLSGLGCVENLLCMYLCMGLP